MKKLQIIVEILDKLILNDDMSEWDLNYIKSYIEASCSKYRISSENVMDDFLLYVNDVYNPEMPQSQKCSWVRSTISWIVKKKVKEAVRYNDSIKTMCDTEDVPSDEYQNMIDRVNLEYVNDLLKKSFTDLEWDIYENYILWTDTQKIIAKRRWISSEWVRKKAEIVKDKIKKTLDF